MSIAKIRQVSAVIPRGVTADTLVLLLHNLRLIDDRRTTEENRFATDDRAASKETVRLTDEQPGSMVCPLRGGWAFPGRKHFWSRLEVVP
jgi:hypothetical protein